MELSNDAYRALEDVVGPEFITKEPAFRDTYNQVWANKITYDQKFSPRPSAILLPGNTEEIQGIVKVCNRYRIPFKPISSGWEVLMGLVTDYGIILDLRRMNHILDLDIKNMCAIVEPYVAVYRLQVEAAKYGLMTGNIGAGPSAGAVAVATSHYGVGTSGVSMGGLGRNVLGVEWVLPTGDVLRLGTARTGNAWFSADGPGISLRGLLRGRGGANGGHGVITKVGIKLYPWYGPPQWEHVKEAGAPPVHRHPKEMPQGYRVFIVTFPNRDSLNQAQLEAAKAEILYTIGAEGMIPPSEGTDEEIAESQNIAPEQMQVIFSSIAFTIGASSEREMAYREKYLLQVCEKYGGKVLTEMNDNSRRIRMFFNTLTRFDNPAVFRRFSELMIINCSDATQDLSNAQRDVADEVYKPYMDSGQLLLFNLPVPIGMFENYSAGCHQESIINYDAYDPVAVSMARKALTETWDVNGPFRRFSVAAMGATFQIEPIHHCHQNWGPAYDNYDIWLRKIKGILDPNNVGDWSGYIPAVYPEESNKPN